MNFGKWTHFRFWSSRSYEFPELLDMLIKTNPREVKVDAEDDKVIFEIVYDNKTFWFKEYRCGERVYFYQVK